MTRFPDILFLLFCIHLFPSVVTAQVFNGGISGGINICQIEGDGFSGYNKAGPAFGVFVNSFLTESLAGQMEINYSSKGSRRRSTIEEPAYYRIDLRYVEIPILVRYFFSAGVIADGGLSVGYLFHAKEEDELGEIPDTLPFRKTEVAAVGGISYLLTENIILNARLSFSIIPVREHAGGGKYFFNRGQNNNVISFIVQYQF